MQVSNIGSLLVLVAILGTLVDPVIFCKFQFRCHCFCGHLLEEVFLEDSEESKGGLVRKQASFILNHPKCIEHQFSIKITINKPSHQRSNFWCLKSYHLLVKRDLRFLCVKDWRTRQNVWHGVTCSWKPVQCGKCNCMSSTKATKVAKRKAWQKGSILCVLIQDGLSLCTLSSPYLLGLLSLTSEGFTMRGWETSARVIL